MTTDTTIPKEIEPVDRPPTAPSILECGQQFQPPPHSGLTLTGHFPTVAGASDYTVAGTVEIASENESVRGVVTANADTFLVRDGRITTLPLPQDLVGTRLVLAPGKVEQLRAFVSLSPCDPRDAEKSLRSGNYELYARLVVNCDDGSSLEAIGGPWPLVLR